MKYGQRSPVAAVTGGSAGVGRATVRELARRGYDVAVQARGRAGLDGAVKDVENAGRKALAVQTDVADYHAVRRAVTEIEEGLGEIAVWVNAAFVGSLAFSWDTPIEQIRRITDVTYYGQVHGTLAVLDRCEEGTTGSSSTWAPRWRTAPSRCKRRIAAPSMPSRASRSRWSPNWRTTAAR